MLTRVRTNVLSSARMSKRINLKDSVLVPVFKKMRVE